MCLVTKLLVAGRMGDSPSCPFCMNYNAMLDFGAGKVIGEVLTCRDCGQLGRMTFGLKAFPGKKFRLGSMYETALKKHYVIQVLTDEGWEDFGREPMDVILKEVV